MDSQLETMNMKRFNGNTGSRLKAMAMAIATALLMIGLTACNTIRGVGEDVSAAGQSMADAAAD